MRLTVRHETFYRYEGGASGVGIRLRLQPVNGATQTVEQWTVTVDGAPVTAFLANSYGVPETAWRAPGRVMETVVVAEGVVETRDTAGIVGITGEAANTRLFLRASDYTKGSTAVDALAREAVSPDGTLATLHLLSTLIHGKAYAAEAGPGMAETNLTRATDMGQAAAHIFITAARSLAIPARYVAGYKLKNDTPAVDETAGDLHGWAEAWVEGLGWVAFDPSVNRCPDDRYVRLSWGMDAYDCAPLRGVALISGDVAMETRLDVDCAGAVASQSQQQ